MSASSQPTSTASSLSQEPFSPSSSPPLILAFLAIGLFSAAMVFVFWRRMQGTRGGWRLTATPLDNIEHALYFNLPNVNIDVPKLWDLSNGGIFARGDQSEKEGAEGLSDVTWVNLMPLSVYKEVMHSPDADGSIEPHPQHPLNNNSLHTISNLNPLSYPFSWWNRKQSPSRHDDDDGDKESEKEVTMRLTITIALPSPEYPIHIKNTGQEAGKNNMDRQIMTDYCIGTYECPWH